MFSVAVINQKGGVGKTTTVANLGAAVAERGCGVCLMDLDPQAHLTLHFNIDPAAVSPTVYDILTDNIPVPDARFEVDERIHVVPSTIDLAAAEVELAGTVGREQILRDALEAANLPDGLLLIDCPPSLGLLTLNALAAVDEVLIPLQPHFFALQGLGKLLETVRLVQRRINPRLRVGGVILCLYETGTRLAAEVEADLRGFFDASAGADCPWAGAAIYRTVIRRNVKLAECPSHGKTIFQYDAGSRGAEDYAALADEFVRRYANLFPAEAVLASVPAPPSGYNPAAAPPIVPPPPVTARRVTPPPAIHNPAAAIMIVPPPPRPATHPQKSAGLYNPASPPAIVPRRNAVAAHAAGAYNPARPVLVVPAT